MSYQQLHVNYCGCNYAAEGVNPHFTCPSCKKPFEPKYKPVASLLATFDFNQKVTFTCPNCTANITLYIAIHKDSSGTSIRLQRSDAEGASGIPSDWWINK